MILRFEVWRFDEAERFKIQLRWFGLDFPLHYRGVGGREYGDLKGVEDGNDCAET